MADESSRVESKARLAGLCYLATFVFGIAGFLLRGRLGVAATLFASASYVAVTFLFYRLYKPVNRTLSLLAALTSLAGCILSALSTVGLIPNVINPLALFGVYCLLIGYLTLSSTFLPPLLGVLMAIGGFGWLTFVSPSLAQGLRPFNMLPGVVGEGALTLWLLIKGVNEPRWRELAGERAGFESAHVAQY